MPRSPATTAPQPSRARPRVTVQMPEHGGDDADDDRPRDRPRLDRRDGEERGEDAEHDARRSRSTAGSRSRALSGLSSRCAQVAHAAASVARALGARPQLPARVPDVEDEDVGADEEHDQALDDVREVAGELGLR